MSTHLSDLGDHIQHHQSHSHVELVRALESIDHVVLGETLGQHVDDSGLNGVEDGVFEDPDLGDVGDLSGWSREQLQMEIIKLRRIARMQLGSNGTGLPSIGLSSAGDHLSEEPQLDQSLNTAAVVSPVSGNIMTEQGGEGKGKRKRRDTDDPASKQLSKRNTETGKRLEKERRPELAKAIRNKMRASVGMEYNSSLVPGPSNDLSEEDGDYIPYFVPNWRNMLDDENTAWVDKLVAELRNEADMGLHSKIPKADFAPDVASTAAYTAFTNLCKRYNNENSVDGAEKRERYIKKRRRWARKDLKQKRRARSAGSPSLGISLPPSALHIDYMSSEYSSAGEDDTGVSHMIAISQKEKWRELYGELAAALDVAGKSGWAAGQKAKVLEVRKPKWRSHQLNDIYNRLDAHAEALADTRSSGTRGPSLPVTTVAPRAGHVAPSHNRFSLPIELARRGKAPRDLGEGWMWQSGSAGVWPSEISVMGDGIDHNEWGGESESMMGEADRLGLVINALDGLQ